MECKMLKILIITSILFSFSAVAQKPKDKEFIREGDRLVEIDSTGQKMYHRQQYKVTQDKICPITTTGAMEHHKNCVLIVKKSAK
jgi:hypothetical protein